MLNKKGQATHIGFMAFFAFVFLILVLMMAGALYYTTSEYLAAYLVHDPGLPNNIYAYRAINVCLAYKDPVSGRYYPGIIDFTKFKEENLESCYLQTNENSFNIRLIDIEQSKDYGKIMLGFGGSLSTKEYPVLIRYQDGSIKKGKIVFGVSS